MYTLEGGNAKRTTLYKCVGYCVVLPDAFCNTCGTLVLSITLWDKDFRIFLGLTLRNFRGEEVMPNASSELFGRVA